MKKAISILLAVLLLAAVCVSAGAEAYTFSSGVQFGMSVEEVRATLAGGKGTGDTIGNLTPATDHVTDLSIAGVQVSKYMGQCSYIFADDRLVAVTYTLPACTEDDYNYLSRALSSVFQEGEPFEIREMLEYVGTLEGEELTEEILERAGLLFLNHDTWVSGDNLTVWMFRMSDGIGMVYRDSSFDPASLEEPDLTNLF